MADPTPTSAPPLPSRERAGELAASVAKNAAQCRENVERGPTGSLVLDALMARYIIAQDDTAAILSAYAADRLVPVERVEAAIAMAWDRWNREICNHGPGAKHSETIGARDACRSLLRTIRELLANPILLATLDAPVNAERGIPSSGFGASPSSAPSASRSESPARP